MIRLGMVLRGALLGGLVAALVAAAFHFVATEPVIEQAIALEGQHAPGDAAHEEPLVSREVQRGGLVVGMLLYGLTWALLLGGAYYLAQGWLPLSGAAPRGLLLALAAYWALGLFPFLKYPANPPAVGDPETITYRQALYLGALGLSLIGVALALGVGRAVAGRGGSGGVGWAAGLAALAAFSLLVYLLLPANPDAIPIPMEIVDSFRVYSLAGLTLFWAILAGVFALWLQRAPRMEAKG